MNNEQYFSSPEQTENHESLDQQAADLLEIRHADSIHPWEQIASVKEALAKREGENNYSVVEKLGSAPLRTEKYGDWTIIAYGDKTDGSVHHVIAYGDVDAGSLNFDPQQSEHDGVLTRMHSACRTNEVFHAVNCECRKELKHTMRAIHERGQGLIIYLAQEGRGTGISGKMEQLAGMFEFNEKEEIVQSCDPETGKRIDTDRAYKDAGYPSECRDFTAVTHILRDLDITKIDLLTNNPLKIYYAGKNHVKVNPIEIHINPDNEIIASDLRSKAENLGHRITLNQANGVNNDHDVQISMPQEEFVTLIDNITNLSRSATDLSETQLDQILTQRQRDWHQTSEAVAENQRALKAADQPLCKIEGIAPLPTEFGDWTKIVLADQARGTHHDCLIFGDFNKNGINQEEFFPVYIHVGNKYQEILRQEGHSEDKLISAMLNIKIGQKGMIIYLDEEAEGAGPVAGMSKLNERYQFDNGKIMDNPNYQSTTTSSTLDYEPALFALKHFGIKKVELLGGMGDSSQALIGKLMMSGLEVKT